MVLDRLLLLAVYQNWLYSISSRERITSTKVCNTYQKGLNTSSHYWTHIWTATVTILCGAAHFLGMGLGVCWFLECWQLQPDLCLIGVCIQQEQFSPWSASININGKKIKLIMLIMRVHCILLFYIFIYKWYRIPVAIYRNRRWTIIASGKCPTTKLQSCMPGRQKLIWDNPFSAVDPEGVGPLAFSTSPHPSSSWI